ncbi:conserved hypothetical protein [Pseudomonas chlororaphis]|uniref:ABC-three component system middle component 6 n=1 Tax=Pseudomonas chlororaphis TaxID=587753 RepID=UPI0039E1AF74
MLPNPGCDPEINVIVLGAKVLKQLMTKSVTLDWLLQEFSREVKVSVDHMILCVDWLYAIDVIYLDGERICIYEAS